MNLFLAVICLTINPIISLIVITLFSQKYKISNSIEIYWILSFGVLITCRIYGVEWAPGADDDGPIYFNLFRIISSDSTFGLISNDWSLSSIEPIPKIIWGISYSILKNEYIVVYLQTILVMGSIMFLAKTVNYKYRWNLLSISVLAFPNLLSYELMHLYRSALAAGFIALAYNPKITKIKNKSLLLIIACFSHASALFAAVPSLYLMLIKGSKGLVLLSLSFIVVVLFYNSDSMVYQKLLMYLTSDILYDKSIRIFKSFILLVILFLIRKKQKTLESKSAFIVLLILGLLGLINQLTLIVDRLNILLIPVLFMLVIPIQDKIIRIIFFVLCIYGAITLISENSIYRFTIGIFGHPFNIPILDFVFFLNNE